MTRLGSTLLLVFLALVSLAVIPLVGRWMAAPATILLLFAAVGPLVRDGGIR